ncbi:hypothetical protein RIF29_06195 [Crotalaria pallida]|uniref:Uncharacterized protein n=1 Tax=Crotalaria pallida TaxID=3830 RepID=A0AAN9PA70_CROPI
MDDCNLLSSSNLPMLVHPEDPTDICNELLYKSSQASLPIDVLISEKMSMASKTARTAEEPNFANCYAEVQQSTGYSKQ